MIIKEMFQLHLHNNNLPGYKLAMIEENIYAVLYHDEIFIVKDLLNGIYQLCEYFPTLNEYVEYNNIGDEISIEEFIDSAPEIYYKDQLLDKIRLAYLKVAYQ